MTDNWMTPSIKSKHFICKRYQSPAFNICKFLTTRTMPLTHHFRGKISVIFCNNSHYQNFTIYIYAYLRSVDCKTLCSSTSYSICTIFERFYNGCIIKDPMWKTPQLTLPNLTCRCISFSDGYIKKFTSFKIFVKV